MIFAVICHDKPHQAAQRAEHRDAHFAHLDNYADHIIEAGPLLADDVSHSVGSLLIVRFDTRAAVETFSREDPFFQAHIFESVTIRPYKKMIGNT